ncbi:MULTISPECIES: DUF4097 family beta strand repeat-containing protein [Thermomonospora]|uniref:DUF4097 domain-containing protein n=1 Tax=Thermomonospora curvata (strain ATCC 19995 / DSM 43183 / JCM 3096 / KCTC 9072 / NBRC 15933 / NCIMB 10081 / Henssen B9) TaxID=471852 RepID=D1ACF1_THECD|nr:MULTISPECIES: DUF4097 family beta strand repeat-containing protein [Thermomonospora]ACY99210.1 hypothetical protein Tcur_3677 [Thermomonospora curvata DSM 43183]PKK12276.1 MAG: hypothetical protein BUE48_018020 [Thermomonospora sp. CIF 1]
MSRWTIDSTATLEFDGVVALKATMIAGNINVLASDEAPSVLVSEVHGPPLLVSHEAGMLTIAHERILEGMLGWLRNQRARATVTVTVPRECPVQLNLVSADAVITGLSARAAIKSATGDVTLDGVKGQIDANTVSGRIEAQGVDGAVNFTSVSGDLTLAGGSLESLGARTVSGRIAADVAPVNGCAMTVSTVSGEVALRLPESTSAKVQLGSAAGRIDTSFPGLQRYDRPVATNVSGTLGDGAGQLVVNTISGGITLLSKPDDPAKAGTGVEDK